MKKDKIFKPELEERENIVTPGQLVIKRFLRNKLAIAGLVIIAVLALFVIIGPFVSPYGEAEQFKKLSRTTYVYIVTDGKLRACNAADGLLKWEADVTGIKTAPFVTDDMFVYVELADKTVKYDADGKEAGSYPGKSIASLGLKAYIQFEKKPSGIEVKLEDGYLVAYSTETGIKKWDFTGYSPVTTEPFYDDQGTVYAVCEDGEIYGLRVDKGSQKWGQQLGVIDFPVMTGQREFEIYDVTAPMSKAHPLGTDLQSLDVLTRLMYGGRISLLVGYVVVFIELLIGVFLGGIAGYYGKWVDNVIMRIVDVFNCLPMLPILLIIGSMMLAMRVPPTTKLYVLMAVMGLLGWPGIARIVRGQILSLREQEFMVAAEATGLGSMRKIFKHLVPNVMPQLIVVATLGIGGTILTESAMSYLGFGLSFPKASWGNMVDAVTFPNMLQNFMNVWVPPGICILLAVLAFNFIGDGLRDAFDPKMKR